MTETDALQRLENLEVQGADALKRIASLQEQIHTLTGSNANTETDQFADQLGQLGQLWTLVVELFPNAIFKFEGAITIPGVVGTGELGADNVQYPVFSPTTGDPRELPMNRRTRLFGPGA